MKIKTDGWFVVDPAGRVGLAVDRSADESLRYATESDVQDTGLWGVGGNIH